MKPWKKSSRDRRLKKWLKSSIKAIMLIGLATAIALLSAALSPGLAPVMAKIPATHTASNPIAQTEPEQHGKTLFEAGQYQQAADELEQAVKRYQAQGNPLQQAAALANLSLVHQQLGAWDSATAAIAASLSLLQPLTNASPAIPVLAQALEVQGKLQLNRGEMEPALATWQKAESLFRKAKDTEGAIQSQMNQAQALRSLGFYRRSLDRLNTLNATLQAQPNSRQKAIALRNLGDALQVGGSLEQSHTVLEQSLEVAEAVNAPNQIAAALLSLGNSARAQKDAKSYPADAIAYYERAASLATVPLLRIQAQLNQLSLLISQQSATLAASQSGDRIQRLLTQLPAQLEQLPASRAAIYARINFAQTLLNFANQQSLAENQPFPPVPSRTASTLALSPLLKTTLQQAIAQSRSLGDKRAESYSLGTLGTAYEKAAAQLAPTNVSAQTQQLEYARDVTQKALVLAQATNTWDIAYRWQWQLGRLLKQTGNVKDAIAAYDAAIVNLRSLRGDLVSVNPDVQFNFRDSVEPIYRQSVELLLSEAKTEPTTEAEKKTNADYLEKARQRIESLQLAELDNFFREACLEGQRVVLDDIVDKQNPTTTIIYPIVLKDPLTSTVKIQVIAKIPNQPLKLYPLVDAKDFDVTIDQIISTLDDGLTQLQPFQAATRKVYDWLIKPMEQDIQSAIALAESTKTKATPDTANSAAKVETLVFVLDDRLRQVPMAALWDGQQYLVERYGIAISPGLQLLDPQPIKREPLRVLAAGLSNPPKSLGFIKLPYVENEIASITKLGFLTTPLLEQNFTRTTLEGNINAAPFNVVHLATHGQFSSNAKDTFIVAADGPINVSQFDTLLRSRDATRPEAIELLVFSACQTAKNDNRATLGLAGFAVRSGARSTLASLTNVNDESTSLLMAEFYQQLSNPKESITKAEALRRAQVALLQNPTDYDLHAPKLWAPYILIGNWL
ncbi:CHAT domain-containing protein [Leptolyngbyaceae cyanobacterium UHCC 1019]